MNPDGNLARREGVEEYLLRMDQDQNQRLTRLLRDTANGDTQAFRCLYDETSPQLYAIALQMMRADSTADDVLQDAFVQVWHRAGDYHAERGTVMAWLTTIVRYRSIDMLRKHRNEMSLDQDAIDATTMQLNLGGTDNENRGMSGPMASAIAGEDADYLAECLSRLSSAQKQSVALAFFRGMTHQELSRCLAMPLGTIKSRLRRSLMRLKDCLARLGYTHEIPTGTN